MLKRRAYGKQAETALRDSSLGQKRRMDGMSKLLARAGRGLAFKLPTAASGGLHDEGTGSDTDDSDDENNKPDDRPLEPLCVWKSPHNGAEPRGLPSQT